MGRPLAPPVTGTTAYAVITCPQCDARAREAMPENACLHFYKCSACGATLRPRHGDCCVFCSYGDTVCPPRCEASADPRPMRSSLTDRFAVST